uniref:Integrin, alpha 3b n=1 Tax=Erpetoichthys calabaricus TaxID=27687 RepID=A0A8C4T205_ERPCA
MCVSLGPAGLTLCCSWSPPNEAHDLHCEGVSVTALSCAQCANLHYFTTLTVIFWALCRPLQACGHRYVRIMMSGNEEQLRMIGKCFVRGNSLNYDEDDDWQIHHYEVCNPGGDLNMEGMCSMGMAAGMTETDVYIGMPGSFNWQERKLSNLDKSNSYIGYSVLDEKNIFYADRYTIISGAPRDEHKGAVYLLDSQNELVSNMTLNGQQVGSYFGNSLAATDLNNDGWKDLIVGAPFYFDRKRELGGAAYIFMNEGGNFQATPTLVLNGVSESGFGFAVANIGDVNQDGFQGEYAKETKLGTSEKGRSICSSLNPVIDGKDIGTDGIRTFGYSVNGGLDVDENAYPDILVGSLSNKIALLSRNCFYFFFRFLSPLSFAALNFRLEADADRRVPRVRFPNTAIPAVYEAQFKMPAMKCVTVDLILSDNIKDKLQPIVFALNYSIPESRPKSRRGAIQNLDAFPVLSDTQKNRDTREISFQKECGNDNKCRSNLQVTASFTTEQQVDLQILQYSPDVKKLYVTVNVTNYPSATKEAEDAHQAILNITLPSALQYSGVRSVSTLIQLTYFSGTVMGESAMKTGQDVGSLVEYTFTVTMNSEPLGDKGTLQLELEWPYEIANGKWLLYLMAISTKGTAATRCVPPGEEVNPLNLTVSMSLEKILGKEGKKAAIDCSQHTANCIRVHCPLVNMTQEAKVTVRSRVWNSTLSISSFRLLKLFLFPFSFSWQCGFFKRASYYRIMPKYHAVKIRKEERYQFNEGFLTKNPKKKHWVTNWTEMQRYYY